MAHIPLLELMWTYKKNLESINKKRNETNIDHSSKYIYIYVYPRMYTTNL